MACVTRSDRTAAATLSQRQSGVLPNYMEVKQQDINPAMRAILVDWLVEVAEEYKLHTETLFACVSDGHCGPAPAT